MRQKKSPDAKPLKVIESETLTIDDSKPMKPVERTTTTFDETDGKTMNRVDPAPMASENDHGRCSQI